MGKREIRLNVDRLDTAGAVVRHGVDHDGGRVGFDLRVRLGDEERKQDVHGSHRGVQPQGRAFPGGYIGLSG